MSRLTFTLVSATNVANWLSARLFLCGFSQRTILWGLICLLICFHSSMLLIMAISMVCGVGEETMVALCCEACATMVAIWLGVVVPMYTLCG